MIPCTPLAYEVHDGLRGAAGMVAYDVLLYFMIAGMISIGYPLSRGCGMIRNE
jgi:hypothetical protein